MANHAEQAPHSILGAGVLAALTLLTLGWAVLSASRETADSQKMVQHTERVLRMIASTEASLAVAESAHRGYLLTGDLQFTRVQQDAVRQLRENSAALESETVDNTTQRERSRRLATLVEEYASKTIDNGGSHRSLAAKKAPSHALLNQADASIQEILIEMRGEEKRLLFARIDSDAHGQVWMHRLLVIAGILVVGFMLPTLWGLIRQSKARHQAEYRLRSIAHSLPGTVYVLRRTTEGIITFDFLSANAGEMLGISRELLLRDANATRQVMLEQDRAHIEDAIARSAEDLSRLEIEFRVGNPDGTIRWIHSSGIPVRRSNGDTVWNGYWTDITGVKETENALRNAMQRLDDAHTVADLGDWTCDLATGALTWSPQIYRLLGRDPALGPPNLSEGVELFDNGAATTAEAFSAAQETGERQSYEMTARLEEGTLRTVQVIVVPNLDETGAVVGMHGTIQDISSRKALEDRLYLAKEAADSANLAKSDFLATMSHEIRTPLNGMLGILELLDQTPISPDLRAALDTIQESGHSLQRIVDDILDFSKVEAGKLEILPEPTSLFDLATSVQRAYAGNASARGLDFRQHVDPQISPLVLVDGLRLRQILGNFVSNAIKFTLKGFVEVRISLLERQADRELLRFDVEDTGMGIAPERQERLFQPFERADLDIASRVSGTGLGLVISRRLARLMGGEVAMSSELGRGTTMSLTLSLQVADTAHSSEQTSTTLNSELAPLQSSALLRASGEIIGAETPRVLVVDDHPINRMVMRTQLHTLGYQVEDVESGKDAINEWESGRFQLILTDCNMPKMSGYDLARLIRNIETERGMLRTPIIACSANVIQGAREACADAGMDDYIPKPVKLLALADILQRWLPLPSKQGDGTSFNNADEGQEPPESIQPLDARVLQKFSNGDPIVERRALAHFRSVNDVDARSLSHAVSGNDVDQVRHLAHRIKGACGFVGAARLGRVCARLEDAAGIGQEREIRYLMETFHRELGELNAYLDARQ